MAKKQDKIKRTIPIGEQSVNQIKEFRDLIPLKYRNILPEPEDNLKKYSMRGENHLNRRISTQMARRFAPLGLTKDNPIKDYKNHKFRCRGLNQARFNALIGAKRLGLTDQLACDLAGIDVTTLYTWIRKGEKGISPYCFVSLAYKEALAELAVELMAAVKKAGTQDDNFNEILLERDRFSGQMVLKRVQNKTKPKDWKAGAWLLERLLPEFKLNYEKPSKEDNQSQQEDLYMIDALTLGIAERVEDNED